MAAVARNTTCPGASAPLFTTRATPRSNNPIGYEHRRYLRHADGSHGLGDCSPPSGLRRNVVGQAMFHLTQHDSYRLGIRPGRLEVDLRSPPAAGGRCCVPHGRRGHGRPDRPSMGQTRWRSAAAALGPCGLCSTRWRPRAVGRPMEPAPPRVSASTRSTRACRPPGRARNGTSQPRVTPSCAARDVCRASNRASPAAGACLNASIISGARSYRRRRDSQGTPTPACARRAPEVRSVMPLPAAGRQRLGVPAARRVITPGRATGPCHQPIVDVAPRARALRRCPVLTPSSSTARPSRWTLTTPTALGAARPGRTAEVRLRRRRVPACTTSRRRPAAR